jgi:hypothetical protein
MLGHRQVDALHGWVFYERVLDRTVGYVIDDGLAGVKPLMRAIRGVLYSSGGRSWIVRLRHVF